jgi:hypothetical protein
MFVDNRDPKRRLEIEVEKLEEALLQSREEFATLLKALFGISACALREFFEKDHSRPTYYGLVGVRVRGEKQSLIAHYQRIQSSPTGYY